MSCHTLKQAGPPTPTQDAFADKSPSTLVNLANLDKNVKNEVFSSIHEVIASLNIYMNLTW